MIAYYKVIAESEDTAYDKLNVYYEVEELIENHGNEYIFKVFSDPSVGDAYFEDHPDADIIIVYDDEFNLIYD